MYKDKELVIRPIIEEDLYSLWELTFKEDSPEWKKWDAPYFEHKSLSYMEYVKKKEYVNQSRKLLGYRSGWENNRYC